jgi:hypothetical protein
LPGTGLLKGGRQESLAIEQQDIDELEQMWLNADYHKRSDCLTAFTMLRKRSIYSSEMLFIRD